MMYWVICLSCGFKEKKELMPAEELIRQRIRPVPPRCRECNSNNVKTEKA